MAKPDLGKTTLAHLIAKEMGANMKVTSGPTLKKMGDLAAILSNLEKGDILFIDEAHRLNRQIEEVLYPALESRKLHLIIGKGTGARTFSLIFRHLLWLPPPLALICFPDHCVLVLALLLSLIITKLPI